MDLLRPARDPLQPGRVLLLVGLAAGLALFARILGDSLATSQQALQSDALVQGIAGAFQLDALLLVLFGATTMFLAHLVAAQGRGHELGLLRAMGLPARRWPMLLIVEGGLVLILGLLAGIVVGLGLSYTMIPYLSPALVLLWWVLGRGHGYCAPRLEDEGTGAYTRKSGSFSIRWAACNCPTPTSTPSK